MSSSLVHAYEDCEGCYVVTEEDGIKWGVENNDWCSKFNKN